MTEEAFKVCHHHLDTNHHVNNAQYIDMAQEYLPKEWKLSRVRAESVSYTHLHLPTPHTTINPCENGGMKK